MIRQFVIYLVALLILTQCREATVSPMRFGGNIMGTTYSVILPGGTPNAFADSIHALLEGVNKSTSTYDDQSAISQFNESDSCWKYKPGTTFYDHFLTVLEASYDLYFASKGSFDPTVQPLVAYWGFGKNKRPVEQIDTVEVKRLLSLVGLPSINHDQAEKTICKRIGQQLDFSALAKGYAVDVAVEWLLQNQVDYGLVEIGGDERVFGIKSNGDLWRLGVSRPDPSAPVQDLVKYLYLTDQAIATSGNYRNYYEVGDQKYVHTINTQTGMAEESNLLSATVIHPNCMQADAMATACMAAGLEKSKTILQNNPDFQAFLIYTEGDGSYAFYETPEFNRFVEQD